VKENLYWVLLALQFFIYFNNSHMSNLFVVTINQMFPVGAKYFTWPTAVLRKCMADTKYTAWYFLGIRFFLLLALNITITVLYQSPNGDQPKNCYNCRPKEGGYDR
jgi:hypothetical protein